MTNKIPPLTPKTVNRIRRDNYVHHYECRKHMQSQVEDVLVKYQLAADHFVSLPILNTYGCDSYSEEDINGIIRISNSYGLEAGYLNNWYLSEEGWANFQKQWDGLPEPTVDLCRVLEIEQRRLADRLLDGARFGPELAAVDPIALKQLRQEYDKSRWKYFFEVGKRDGFACRVCGAETNLTLDHIIPLARGGPNESTNMQILCRKHNSQKNATTIQA